MQPRASSPGLLRGCNLALAPASLAVDAGFSWGTGESQVWTMITSASPIEMVRLHSGWVGTLETQRYQWIFENILRCFEFLRFGKLSSINQLHRICFLNCCVIGTWLHLGLHCKDLPQWWHQSSRATNGLQRLGLARWVSWHTGEIWRSLSSTWILGISLNFEFFEPFWVTFEPFISSQKHFSIVLSIDL